MGQGDAAVGQRVKTAAAGVRGLAAEAARVGADAAARAVEITDRKLAEGADELAQVGRKATKDFDKGTRASRREVLAHSVAARDEVLARAQRMRDPGRKAAEAVAAVVGSRGDSDRKRRKTLAAARKDLTAALAEAKSAARGEQAKRARWPWLLGVAVVAAAAAAFLRAKRANPLAGPEVHEVPATPAPETSATANGTPAPPKPAATAPKPAEATPKPAAAAPKAAPVPPQSAAAPKGTAAPNGHTPASSPENSKK
jgi:hypothetical protein